MAIPKVIYQTYIDDKLPLITKLFIWWMKRVNPDYRYEFYGDARVENFLKSEFPKHVFEAYDKLAIGASRADFFRYALLFKCGGVYIDIDGAIVRSLKLVISPEDNAIISYEKSPSYFVQWAMLYAKGHAFLERALFLCIENINSNRSPYNVHEMTGPSVYTQAINECLEENPSTPYRIMGVEYDHKKKRILIPKHFLNRIMYFRHEHWTRTEKKRPVLKMI